MTTTGEHTATESMGRLLGKPVPLAPWVLRCGSRLTQRWTRDGFDGYAPPMPGHLVAAYHSVHQVCSWTHENRPLEGMLRPGTITLIPDRRDGQWRLGGRVDVSHVYLTTQRLQSCAEALGASAHPVELRARVGTEDPTTTHLMTILASEAGVGDTAAAVFVERAVDLLCLHLLRAHGTTALVAPRTRGGLARWQVSRVLEYMNANLAGEVQLAELAALVGLTRYHFCTAFRRATGQTPHEALTSLRIGRAKRLLDAGELRVTEVALAVGYHTPSAFAASFRRVMGVTPTRYRQGR